MKNMFVSEYIKNCVWITFNLIFKFIYFWLCWVLVSVWGLSPVVASGGHCSSRCAGLSPSRPLLLRSTGFRCAGSVVVAHGPSRSAACGIFPDQGSNPCPLHWQADSQPLRHQGSPNLIFGFLKGSRLFYNLLNGTFPRTGQLQWFYLYLKCLCYGQKQFKV